VTEETTTTAENINTTIMEYSEGWFKAYPPVRLEPAKGKPTRDTFRHGSPRGRCEPPPFKKRVQA